MRLTFIALALALALASQAAVVTDSAANDDLPAPSTCSAAHRRDYYDSTGGNGDKVLWDNLKATKRDPLLGENLDVEMWKALNMYRTGLPFASATATATRRSLVNWKSVCGKAWGRERFGSLCESMGLGISDFNFLDKQTAKPSDSAT